MPPARPETKPSGRLNQFHGGRALYSFDGGGAIHGGCAHPYNAAVPGIAPGTASASLRTDRQPPFQEPAGGRCFTCSRHPEPSGCPSRRVIPVTPFVCAVVPGTTRWHAPVNATALPRSPVARRRLLLGALSQTVGFEAPGGHARHRLPHRHPQSFHG